jgi:molecular chaperone GrpE
MRDRKSHPSSHPAAETDSGPDTANPAGAADLQAPETGHDPADTDAAQAASEPGMTLANEIEELQRSKAELNDRLLRVLAEYDNFRRRNQAERIRWHRESQEEVVLGLLPVKDDLERMLAQSADTLTLESLLNGLRLIGGKLERSLEQFGVQRVDSQGQPFDPELHSALTTASDPSQPDGAVLMEHLKGYRMGDRIIRHAQVVVNRLEESTPTPETSEDGQ